MPEPNDNLLKKLQEIDEQYESLQAELLDPDVLADHRKVRTLSVRRAAMAPIVEGFRAWNDTVKEMADLEGMLATETDEDLLAMARTELPTLSERADQLLEQLQQKLVMADDETIGSVILEIRSGVGGDEAALFAGDILEMYRRFAARRKWAVEDIEFHGGEQGGCRGATLSISGEGAWSSLGYEGGTHQVKRVPATETQGRVHTSTATVAVLPEPEDVEVELNPDDVKEMITTATGPGGQNVNKVSTAVHLIHQPTGVEVRMQDTKSQAQNKQKAWQLLKARLWEKQRAEAEAERAEARNKMIGSGGRAEKIRTYRYKDNLVVDHRVGSSFNLSDTVGGNLQPLVDELIELDTANRLASL
ncbi:MAG: PCRF domain-containing protein [Phycisphaerales bacterium]|nr:PCRF domain-containing protein [Phycisphaerales bacterium]